MDISSIFAILFWLWTAAEIFVAIKTYTKKSGGEIHDRGSLRLLWAVNFCCIWAGLTIGSRPPHTMLGGAYWLMPLATALIVIGLAIRFTAIAQLGKSFSVNVAIHATQTVTRTGLFRFVRHPSYTGLTLIFISIGVFTRNWLALAILFIPPLLALLYRIHVEEIALNQAFADYADYSRSTKRLIPGIY